MVASTRLVAAETEEESGERMWGSRGAEGAGCDRSRADAYLPLPSWEDSHRFWGEGVRRLDLDRFYVRWLLDQQVKTERRVRPGRRRGWSERWQASSTRKVKDTWPGNLGSPKMWVGGREGPKTGPALHI